MDVVEEEDNPIIQNDVVRNEVEGTVSPASHDSISVSAAEEGHIAINEEEFHDAETSNAAIVNLIDDVEMPASADQAGIAGIAQHSSDLRSQHDVQPMSSQTSGNLDVIASNDNDTPELGVIVDNDSDSDSDTDTSDDESIQSAFGAVVAQHLSHDFPAPNDIAIPDNAEDTIENNAAIASTDDNNDNRNDVAERINNRNDLDDDGNLNLEVDGVDAAVHERYFMGLFENMVQPETAGDGHELETAYRDLVASIRRERNPRNLLILSPHLRRAFFTIEHRLNRRRRTAGNQQSTSSDNAAAAAAPAPDGESTTDVEELPRIISFDTNLPAEHTYMGNNFNRVSGVNYLETGQTHKILTFLHQHILYPGEVLPFMFSGPYLDPEIDAVNGLFGVCFPFLLNADDPDTTFGVTCQIYEKGTNERGKTLIKSRVLQRFSCKTSDIRGPLQYITDRPEDKCYAFVKILPEIYLGDPLDDIKMGSLARFNEDKSMTHMYKRHQMAATPWAPFVYELYDVQPLVEKARAELHQHKIETMPTDPVHLSFWLVRNLHLSQDLMKDIFLTDSVYKRMKLIASTINDMAIFVCRFCNNTIANCRELFAMSKHGIQSQYCNSAGYVHETNTFYHLTPRSVSHTGEPSTEFSWFPGYQWQIIVCKICARHVGWEFTAVETDLEPKKFFGISSSSVVQKSDSIERPTRNVVNLMLEYMRNHIN